MKKIIFVLSVTFLTLLVTVVVKLDLFAPGNLTLGNNLISQLGVLPDRSLIFAQLGDQVFQFEVVNSAQSISKGLSDREKIGSDGMLFVFPHPDAHGIWMLDMKFNLDIIWIFQGEVIGFELNAVKPQENNQDLIIYQPPQPVELVLETKAGFVDQHQIKIGDRLELVAE